MRFVSNSRDVSLSLRYPVRFTEALSMQVLRLLWFVPPSVAVVADEMKLATDVHVVAHRNPSSDAQFAALSSGEVDAVVTAMDNVMNWNQRSGPSDFCIVAQIESTTPLTVMGQRSIEKLEDLDGGRILVDAPYNGFVVALLAMLAAAGVSRNSIQLIETGGVKERFDALVAGVGDATLLGPPFDAMALGHGLRRIAGVQDFYPQFPGQALVVSAAQIPRLRSSITSWLKGLEGALRLMHADPGSSRVTLIRSGFPESAAEAMLAAAPRSLRPDREGVELIIRQRAEAGLPGSDTSYDQLVDASMLPDHREQVGPRE